MRKVHEGHVKLFNEGVNLFLKLFGNSNGNFFILLEHMVDNENTIYQNVKHMD